MQDVDSLVEEVYAKYGEKEIYPKSPLFLDNRLFIKDMVRDLGFPKGLFLSQELRLVAYEEEEAEWVRGI